jgi:hypothetical protein
MEEAIHNLDLAIRLFIKENEGSAAILLAGAAEEDFEELLKKNGLKASHQIGKERLAQKTGLTEKEINDEYTNKVKNWLKHGGSPSLIFDKELTASQMIIRAITNYYKIKKSIRQTHADFFEYIKNNFKELEMDPNENYQNLVKSSP